jgi:phosphoribosylamine-glycine ligase
VVVGPGLRSPMGWWIVCGPRASPLGPRRDAAAGIGKSFAKEFMRRHGIPTGLVRLSQGRKGSGLPGFARSRYPLVVKADLAAGRRVIAPNAGEARATVAGSWSGAVRMATTGS